VLGALRQALEMAFALFDGFRRSLNQLSRFDFGHLRPLRYAREWQPK
jgi:hypothetical protein